MTTTTRATTRTTTPDQTSRRTRAWRVAGWVVRAVLAAQFVGGGLAKLVAEAQMVDMFDDIGGGAGLRILVGACEVLGGLGVLLPRTARPAAVGLAALLVGAIVTNVVVLDASPVIPAALLALALVALVHSGREITR